MAKAHVLNLLQKGLVVTWEAGWDQTLGEMMVLVLDPMSVIAKVVELERALVLTWVATWDAEYEQTLKEVRVQELEDLVVSELVLVSEIE